MDIIGSVMASRTSSKLIFIIGLLWAASNMFNFVFSGINHAWNPKRTRGFIRGRLLALFAVTGVAILAVVLLIISFFIRLIAGLYPWLGNQLFTIGLPLLTQTFLIYLLYKYGPDTVVERKSGVISAILVTIAIDITTRGFTWYLNSDLSSYTTLYGSLGAVIGLLFWVYLSDWILLFGA